MHKQHIGPEKLPVKTQKQLPAYEKPRIMTYTDEEILEELGPAQANTTGPIM